MAKYKGGNYFAHVSFPEVGQKQKTERKKEEERLNYGNNNGQLRIVKAISSGARKATWANFCTACITLMIRRSHTPSPLYVIAVYSDVTSILPILVRKQVCTQQGSSYS